jgi:hypothetical protein
MLYQHEHPRETQIIKLYAFLGRYAHQDVSSLRTMPVHVLEALARETAELLREEHDAMTANTD